MDMQTRTHEQLSALADGELDESERELALAALATPDGQQYWRACHLVRVVLQADGEVAAADSSAFQARLAQRLAAEPAYSRNHGSAHADQAGAAGGTETPSSATLS